MLLLVLIFLVSSLLLSQSCVGIGWVGVEKSSCKKLFGAGCFDILAEQWQSLELISCHVFAIICSYLVVTMYMLMGTLKLQEDRFGYCFSELRLEHLSFFIKYSKQVMSFSLFFYQRCSVSCEKNASIWFSFCLLVC